MGLGLVFIAALVVAWPLYGPWFHQTSDGLLHLYRAIDFQATLVAGGLWPRLAPTLALGFGYPVFTFYSPAVYYVAAIAQIVGFSPAGAFNQIAWLCLFPAGLSAYAYARLTLPRLPAGVVGALYLAAPYHIYDIYERGDFPQALAYALIPLVFWGIHRLARRPIDTGALVLGAVAASVVLTHNLTAYLVAPFAALYAAVLGARMVAAGAWQSVTRFSGLLAGAAVCAALLTTIQWLPIVAESDSVQLGRLHQLGFRDNFLALPALFGWDLVPVYRSSDLNAPPGAARLTLLQTAALLSGLAALIWALRRRRSTLAWEIAAQIGVAALALFLMTAASEPFWDRLPLLSHAQFPSRFAALLALPIAYLPAAAIAQVFRRRAIVGVAVVAAFVGAAALFPAVYSAPTRTDLTTLGSLHLELAYGIDGGVSTGEFLPVQRPDEPWVSPHALRRVAGREPLPTDPVLTRVAQDPFSRRYVLDDWPGGARVLDTFAYPGWQALLDGEPMTLTATEDGFVRIEAPPGDHEILLQFRPTREQFVAGAVSAATAGLLLIAALLRGRVRRLVQWRGRRTAAVVALVGLPLLPLGLWTNAPAATDPRPLDIEFGDARLTGFQTPLVSVQPGETLPVRLDWEVREVSPGLTIYARLVNRTGHGWAASETNVTPGWGSSRLSLDVPLDAPPGSYALQVGFRTPDGAIAATDVRHTDRLPFFYMLAGPITVRSAPAGAISEEGPVFGDQLRLTSYRLGVRRGDWRTLPLDWPVYPDETPLRARAGWMLHGDWHWQMLNPDGREISVSFRLIDETGFVWASSDGPPLDGLYPTSYWQAGERVFDQRDLYLPPDIPPGQYRLVLVAASGENQLSVGGNGLRRQASLDLGSVVVEPGTAWPSPAEYTDHRVDWAATDALTLLTLSPEGTTVQAGDRLSVGSRWLARQKPASDVLAVWELSGSDGAVAGRVSAPLTGQEGYPPNTWEAGTIVRGRHQIAVHPTAAAGRYTLYLTFVNENGAVLGRWNAGEIRVDAPERTYQAGYAHPLGVAFDESLELAGFDTPENARVDGVPDDWTIVTPAGRPFAVDLWWRGLRTSAPNATVFVQLLDDRGRLVAQSDSPPAGGSRPVSGIVPGEFVRDRHVLGGSAALPSGDYTLIAGLYDPPSGVRLTTPDGATFAKLATLHLTPSG